MDMTELKAVFDEQGKLWTEFKKTNDERLAKMASGESVAELDTKLAKMEDRLSQLDAIKSDQQQINTKLDEAIKRIMRPGMAPGEKDLAGEIKTFNDFRRAMSRPGHTVSDVDAGEYSAYKTAFEKAVRHGEKALSSDEIKVMQAGVDPDGGYLLPPPAVGRVVSRIYERSPFRQLVSTQSISGNEIEGIEDLDEAANGGWVGETTTRNETNTPQVGKWKIEAHETYCQPKITQRLLDDGAVNVEEWLANKVADKFLRVESIAFHTGDGVAKPRGLFSYTEVQTADATRPWGSFESVKTGVNGAFAGSNPADILFDLIGAFKDYYLQGASFLTRREVITAIRKFKESTTNGYLWQPGLQAGQPDRLLGYPLVISQEVPALGSGSLSLALGNFAEAYLIVDRLGVRTLRDPYTEKPYVKFYSTRRVGGGAVNFEAVKFLKFGA